MISRSTRARSLALCAALLATSAARAQSTACAPVVAGGVVVSENRRAVGARIDLVRCSAFAERASAR